MSLTSKQRQYLRGLAHPLAPIVRIGKGGLSDSVVAETRQSLHAHELVKVRIEADAGDDRKALAQQLAEAVDAEIAGIVGKIAILYRARDEDPEIKLPVDR